MAAGILGISLGTTTIGVAYIHERELQDFNTHSFRATWSDNKADAIVNRIGTYFNRYDITLVLIKVPPKAHQPESIGILLKKVLSYISYKGCMVEVCTKAGYF